MTISLLPGSKKQSNDHQSTARRLDFKNPCLNALEVNYIQAEKQMAKSHCCPQYLLMNEIPEVYLYIHPR